MDIETAIREYPAVGIPFLLCAVLSGCLLLGFVLQWNTFSVAMKHAEGIREDAKDRGTPKALLRWYLLGDFLAIKRIFDENRSSVWILISGIVSGLAAWALYEILANLMLG